MVEIADETTPEVDPFGPTQAPGIQLVIQLRIYDALMAILTHLDADQAKDLYELHLLGKTLSPAPNLEVEW